jgi:hypothetical protein
MLVSISIFVLAVLIIAGSCATQKTAQEVKSFEPLYDSELVGTWINTEYSGENFQKILVTDYGYSEGYLKADSEYPTVKFTFFVVEKWTDSDGNVWCKTVFRGDLFPRFIYELDKISSDGKTWAYVKSFQEFRSESDLTPDNPLFDYKIYYRQE